MSGADKETNDRGQCWQCSMDSRRKKMEEGKESNAKRHLPLPRTVKISIACFFHVDDGNVLLLFFFSCFFVLFFFSRGGKPSSSTCCYGFVCEGENVVSLKNLTGILLDHSVDGRRYPVVSLHSAAGGRDV